jgi:hypothetical protein
MEESGKKEKSVNVTKGKRTSPRKGISMRKR